MTGVDYELRCSHSDGHKQSSLDEEECAEAPPRTRSYSDEQQKVGLSCYSTRMAEGWLIHVVRVYA
jgi:hypothetical protein